MDKIIHNVRRQPEEVRRHILHVITAVFAIILFLLWVVSLGRNFEQGETAEKTNKELQPLSALKANILGGYQSLTEPAPPAGQD